jgi:hypothetical protein
MKFTELGAVAELDQKAMAGVLGGLKLGELLSDLTSSFRTGIPHLPVVEAARANFGVTNDGQLIQAASDVFGFPGNNTVKYLFEVDMPRGLG